MAVHRFFSPTHLLLLILLFAITTFLLFSLRDDCTCTTVDTLVQRVRSLQGEARAREEALADCRGDDAPGGGGQASWDPHALCLLVPLRDRFEELMEFVPYMDKFLGQQLVRHRIIIINQIDAYRFNRASLLNVGFKESREGCSYIALHDVDLLPRNPAISYHYAKVVDGPFHASSPKLHPRYDYAEFIGGILLMSSDHFEKLNGLSNRFWGWGREDDELYMRIQEADLKISRPEGISTGKSTFFHIHDKKKRKRDMRRIGNQHKESFKRDRKTGLDTVQYDVRNQQELTINGAKATLLHVKLQCDKDSTPWCEDEK